MKFKYQAAIILVFLASLPSVFGELTEDSIFMNSLLNTTRYDKRIRPYHMDATLNITVQMTIVSFGDVEEKNNEFSLDMFFKQTWVDPRLRHNSNDFTLAGNDKCLIWLPDTFFTNIIAAQQHVVPSDNSVAVITNQGKVTYSTRITLTASCEMDLRKYPLDSQTCQLQIMSYAYAEDEINYQWKGNKDQSIQIMNDHLAQLALVAIDIDRRIQKFGSGMYFCELLAIFKYERRLGFSFLQIYAPTFLIVCLSWLSFWIAKDAIPARIALGVTTVLTIVTLNGSFRSAVPKVSYIKAMDLYLIASFFFVFGSVLEYIAVLTYDEYIKHKKALAKKLDMDVEDDENQEPPPDVEAMEEIIVSKEPEKCTSYSLHNKRNRSRFSRRNAQELLSRIISVNSTPIDKISKIAFPCCYGLFNIVYWMYYSLSEN